MTIFVLYILYIVRINIYLEYYMATINVDEFLNKYRDNGYGNDNDDEESNNSPLN